MSNVVLSSAQVKLILGVWGVQVGGTGSKLAMLAVRDADGDGNEVGVYDDKVYVLAPDGPVKTWKCNTDPSSIVDGRAQMETGQVAYYRAGIHKVSLPPGNPRRYPAFRQHQKAWFKRHGVGREFDNIAANLHHGSASGGTSSLACQTIPIETWDGFRSHVYESLGVNIEQVRANPMGAGPVFPYVILSREQVRAALDKGESIPKAEAETKLGWIYYYDGHQIDGVKMVGGLGYAPTRQTLAMLTGKKPEDLSFAWTKDGSDTDDKPDLSFEGKYIHVLDASLTVTHGRIVDLAAAAGCILKVNEVGRVVSILPPVK
jgi:hypothetical protein